MLEADALPYQLDVPGKKRPSKQLLLIHVTGTLDQPQLTCDPLPLLKDTLEQIFPETGGGEVLSSLPPFAAPAAPPPPALTQGIEADGADAV